MIRPQLILDVNEEMIVDNFAGGGGASTGIELALGRHVDVAVNHDAQAVALHSANHPQTKHFCEDVFKIKPEEVTGGRRVGLAWFSPDCKHFSKAKGGKPRSKKIRGLAWVVVKWAANPSARPRVIVLENVEEFQKWGPLLANGNPCPKRQGRTFRNFIKRLENLGYAVEFKELRASDYGAPTIRKRLYLIARCDGKPIVWPKATHGNPAGKDFRVSKLKPWRTAAECIDWSLPCHSIFLTKEEGRAMGVKRPLVEATERRLARGTVKFVIEAKEPFFVSLTHQGGDRVEAVTEPFKTLTGAHRGEKALAVPMVIGAGGPAYGGKPRTPQNPFNSILAENHACLASAFLTEHANASNQRNFAADESMRTQCAEVKGGHFALVEAFLSRHFGKSVGNKPSEPLPTTVAGGGGKTALVASHLTKFYGTNIGQKTDEPLHSITAQGLHVAEVRAFLMKYYGEGGQDQDIKDPLHTIPTRDRFGLVLVRGETYQISDIGMRMLIARELYRGQGFPDSYIIQIQIDVMRHGKLKRVALSQEAQVRMCGNSVCPPVAAALVAANVPEMAVWRNGDRKEFNKKLKALCAR